MSKPAAGARDGIHEKILQPDLRSWKIESSAMSTCKCTMYMFGESIKLCNGDFRWSWKILPWGSWGQKWPGSRRWQFYKVEEAGRSISRECPGNRGSKFFAMIPISNLAVAGDVDHGKRSVRSPAETEHCHHDNHLATLCKHRSDWCTLACSNLQRKTQILNDAVMLSWVNSFDGFY